YDVLYDHLRGIQRIWLVGSSDPHVDAATLASGGDTVAGDATTTLTIAGGNFDTPTVAVYLGGTRLAVTNVSATSLSAVVPHGTSVGWQDLLVTNGDGSA